MKASREKKIAFINSFGRNAIEMAIMEAVHRHGAEHFLTNEQIDDITSEQVAKARSMNWHVIRNRNAIRSEIAADKARNQALAIKEKAE